MYDATRVGEAETDTQKWVRTDDVRRFDLVPGEQLTIGTDYYYGCTVWAILGPRAVIFGHIAQEGTRNCGVWFSSYETTLDRMTEYIEEVMAKKVPSIALQDVAGEGRQCDMHAWIMGSVADRPRNGPRAMKQWLHDDGFGVPEGNIHYLQYSGGSNYANRPPRGPSGKALVTVEPTTTGATLRAFFSSNTARITIPLLNPEPGNVHYRIDPNGEVTISTSEQTT